jgi:hypothetical protein
MLTNKARRLLKTAQASNDKLGQRLRTNYDLNKLELASIGKAAEEKEVALKEMLTRKDNMLSDRDMRLKELTNEKLLRREEGYEYPPVYQPRDLVARWDYL